SPTILTHICRRWRDIALATPALWRAISLTYTDDDASDSKQLHIVGSWLSRSGSCPLSIKAEDILTPISRECMDRVLLHQARWEHVKLRLEAPSHLAAVQQAMPLLRQLELQVYGTSTISSIVTCAQMPELRCVTLWDFPYPEGFLPWSQLTSLTLVWKSTSDCTSVLRHTVNLLHCVLVTTPDLTRPPDVELRCLKSLVLMKYSEDEDPTTQYLDTLITPDLLMLQVPEEFLGPMAITTLKSFISKSGCTLQRVCITGKTTLSLPFYRFAFPSIPELSLDPTLTTFDQTLWRVHIFLQ
ncbi:hypothetical protein B0H13DRAFT_1620978, partial [Mycena leptocephala]